jgi:hypothetical protein
MLAFFDSACSVDINLHVPCCWRWDAASFPPGSSSLSLRHVQCLPMKQWVDIGLWNSPSWIAFQRARVPNTVAHILANKKYSSARGWRPISCKRIGLSVQIGPGLKVHSRYVLWTGRILGRTRPNNYWDCRHFPSSPPLSTVTSLPKLVWILAPLRVAMRAVKLDMKFIQSEQWPCQVGHSTAIHCGVMQTVTVCWRKTSMFYWLPQQFFSAMKHDSYM